MRTDADLANVHPSTGIVWAYRFAADGTAQRIPNSEVDEALSQHSGAWIWVHLALADNRCRGWIASYAPLSDIAREVLTSSEKHLRLDIIGDEIVGVVPDLHQGLVETSDDLVRLRFVMTERMMITARQHPVHSVEHNRRAIESGKRFPNAVSFLDAIIDQFADAIARMAERLGNELDVIEESVMHDEPGDEQRRVGKIRLQTVRVHRQLAQLKSMFARLEPRLAGHNKLAAEAVGALAHKLDAIDHEIGSLYERARLLLDEAAAKVSAITNKRLFTLSILTACLLPPTLVTGFFGMNTKDMPFQNTDGGTWLALMVAFAAGAISYWALRRMRAL
ncbi:MAG: CorA family divalent cation transporter [Pseudolabrys sp.]|jgi:zinc transporter